MTFALVLDIENNFMVQQDRVVSIQAKQTQQLHAECLMEENLLARPWKNNP